MKRNVAIVFVVLLLLVAAAAWRSAPSAGEGEVLVLSGRSESGPVRVWTAPWSARAVLPQRLDTDSSEQLDLGQGSSWPVKVRARLDLEPAQMDDAARRELLNGAEQFRERFAEWVRTGLTEIRQQPEFDPREMLFRPGAVSESLQRALGPRVPEGIRIVSVEARVEVPEAAARSNALAEARSRGSDPVARVLYIGLDGADWMIVDPLIARGELPVLSGLVQRGARADLLAYEPIMSPLLWTTAITGQGPDVHGIFDFTLADAAGNQVPISSRYRESPAIWEILGAWGDSSAFVNFWATHPTEEMSGVLVSDIADTLMREGDRPTLPAGAAWPAGFVESVRGLWKSADVPLAALRRYVPTATDAELEQARLFWSDAELRADFAEGKQSDERKVPPIAFLTQVIANSHNLERITDELLGRPDLGVVGVYFGEIDQVGHNFQHLAPPPHVLADPQERLRFADVVENCYRQQDAMLGRLIDAAGPDTVVLIHSDHGFRWGVRRPRDVLPFTRGQPVEWHRLQGVFVAAGGPVREGARVDDVTLYDIAPTILALRGVPPAEDMPGRVRDDILQPAAAARLPAQRTPEWSSLVAQRSYAQSPDGGDLDEMRQEMVEQLRALGYVGGGLTDDESADVETTPGATGEERPQVTFYRNKATWMMNEDRFAEAEAALLEANRLKKLPKTYSLLSEARAAQGNLEGAARALDDGFEEFPDKMPASAVLWLVELQLERGDIGAAAQALDRGRAARGPEAAPLIVAQGRIAEARGDTTAARQTYLRALEADPREVRAAQRYAGLAPSAAEKARLEPYLRQALELDPRIEIYWQMLGLIRLDQGDPAGAADAFGEAADLDPAAEGNRLNEALARLQAGQPRRARPLLEALAARGSRHPGVWVNLGNLRAGAGDWAGARSAWERAVGLGADSPRLGELLEEADRRLGVAGG